jgi:hypothetical protein
MNVETRREVVRRFHDGGRSRDDAKSGTFAGPIDVAMAVHHHHPAGQKPQPANKPVAVDQGRPDPLGQSFGGPGILDDMMMERDDPGRVWVLPAGDLDAADLFRRDQSECIREREMRIGVGVQQDHSEAVILLRGQHQRKCHRPDFR